MSPSGQAATWRRRVPGHQTSGRRPPCIRLRPEPYAVFALRPRRATAGTSARPSSSSRAAKSQSMKTLTDDRRPVGRHHYPVSVLRDAVEAMTIVGYSLTLPQNPTAQRSNLM